MRSSRRRRGLHGIALDKSARHRIAVHRRRFSRGHVLLLADNHTLATASDWSRALRAGKGKVVTLVILRDKHEQTLQLPLDVKHHSMVEWPKVPGGAGLARD